MFQLLPGAVGHYRRNHEFPLVFCHWCHGSESEESLRTGSSVPEGSGMKGYQGLFPSASFQGPTTQLCIETLLAHAIPQLFNLDLGTYSLLGFADQFPGAENARLREADEPDS